ncbi:RyR domain [Mycobacteroides abscessus subsp. abscessus]|nr:RyR domain [Mycobacteroides abscessus subsp. abscessus]
MTGHDRLLLSPREIARVCHEANRALQKVFGDESPSPEWDVAPSDQRESCIRGVTAALDGMDPEALHTLWMVDHAARGWTYGPVKDRVAKTHPCLLPYDELPEAQRLKDRLFLAIVKTLTEENQ